MGWKQRAAGSGSPNLERVRCEFSFEQLNHLARRQAMADQHSLVRRPVIPGGCNHAFDLCGGHSRDRSGHGLIVCHVAARPTRCSPELNLLMSRLISLGTRVFNARHEWECAAELMGLEAPGLTRALEGTDRCNRENLAMTPHCLPVCGGVSCRTTALSDRTGNAATCLTSGQSEARAVMP